jgi:hypothetical protein
MNRSRDLPSVIEKFRGLETLSCVWEVSECPIPFLPLSNVDIVTCWVYVTGQITSRHIECSEFIPLALTFTQFTVSQVLPSAVSQLFLLLPLTPTNARMQLTGYSFSRDSLTTHY